MDGKTNSKFWDKNPLKVPMIPIAIQLQMFTYKISFHPSE